MVLLVVLICISLVSKDVEYLFIFFIYHMYIYLLWWSVQIFCPFFNCAIWFLWLSFRVLCIFWIQIFYQICNLKVLSPSVRLVILLSWQCPRRREVLNLKKKVQLIKFSFINYAFVISKLLSPNSRLYRVFFYVFLQKCYSLAFYT